MAKNVYSLITAVILFVSFCGRHESSERIFYHPESLRIFNEEEGKHLSLHLPDGYHIRRETGIDFLLYSAVPVDTTGMKSKGTLGIYVGHHPNRLFPQGDTLSIADGNVGLRYRWNAFVKTVDGQSMIVCDALDERLLQGIMPRSEFGTVHQLQLHFFISATDKKTARLLIRSAESIQVVKE